MVLRRFDLDFGVYFGLFDSIVEENDGTRKSQVILDDFHLVYSVYCIGGWYCLRVGYFYLGIGVQFDIVGLGEGGNGWLVFHVLEL